MTRKITVLGAGAWGTALAASVARSGIPCVLWGRNAEAIGEINLSRRNRRYLGEIALPDHLEATSDAGEALDDARIVLVALPAQTLRPLIPGLVDYATAQTVFVSCAKGIDHETGQTMTEIIARSAGGERAGVLSGPSFAADVAAGLPTAVTVAAGSLATAGMLATALSSRTLRCYATDDITGVELGGALKNVLAIAAGIVFGRNLGASALAALTTRGFAELQRVARALGGRPETLAGLSGLGDLILTCSSEKSRNFAYGAAMGHGGNLAGRPLAEGVHTAAMASQLAHQHDVDAPIIDAVAAVLSGKLTIDAAVEGLLSRPLKTET